MGGLVSMNLQDIISVIEFVQSGQVLKPTGDAKEVFHDCCVVGDLESIDIYREPDAIGAKIGGLTNWSDIRSIDEAEYFDQDPTIKSFRNSISPLIDEVARGLWGHLSEQLQSRLPNVAINQIHIDSCSAMRFRALFGIQERFMSEQLYKKYQLGGFPCGWEGSYPEGRFVILVLDEEKEALPDLA